MPRGVYKRTPECNANNSKSKKGKNNPMYGRHHSDKTRDAMSVSHTDIPLSPAHCAALSAARKGVPKKPLSPEHRTAMSVARKNSGAVKTASDAMRGGHDIVKHHYIYDHDNPDQHTIEITRSQHTAHHQWMKRNGLKVPHYNMKE